MKEKFYSIKGQESDVCYPIEHFQQILKDGFGEGIFENVKMLELEVWEKKIKTGTFWCMEHGEGYESGDDTCGKFNCSEYKPRNGKSGICVWNRLPHFPTGKTVVIEKGEGKS